MQTDFQRRRRNTDLTFSVVVVAGYAVLFASYGYPIYAPESLWIIVLGAIYLGLGLYGSRLIDDPQRTRPELIWAYLAFEIALGTYIIYIGNSGAWLIVLPLVSTAIGHLPRPWAIATCVVIWLGQIMPICLAGAWGEAAGWGMAFLSAIVFVAVFTQVAVDERNARGELVAVNQKLREYAAQIEELAVVQERNRLAREIHDGLGHYLTAINIQLKAAQAMNAQDPKLANEALNNAQTLTQEALTDVRRSISALRADPSTSRPLAETLSRLLAEIRTTGVRAELEVEGPPQPLAPQIEFTLYRAVQEALTNVRKHAHASRVDLRLIYSEHAVQVTLSDNGVGSDEPSGGFGLLGLQERVQLVGGTLHLTTARGEGFKIEVSIPI
jgi:signal transduction histidine kinase